MKSSQTYRVLIADDSPVVQDALSASVGAMPGLRIERQAFTGRETIAAIRATQPDIVLLDVEMPEGGGLDVLAAIRDDAHRPLVLVLTFHPEDFFRARCRELGAHGFFDKTKDIGSLFATLAEIGRGELTLAEAMQRGRGETP